LRKRATLSHPLALPEDPRVLGAGAAGVPWPDVVADLLEGVRDRFEVPCGEVRLEVLFDSAPADGARSVRAQRGGVSR
jgi:hypothetical protein